MYRENFLVTSAVRDFQARVCQAPLGAKPETAKRAGAYLERIGVSDRVPSWAILETISKADCSITTGSARLYGLVSETISDMEILALLYKHFQGAG